MSQEYALGGINAVREALQQGQALELWLDTKKRGNVKIQELQALAEERRVPVLWREGHQLDMDLPGLRHQGAGARCQPRETVAASWAEAIAGQPAPLLLILDSIQDPHNLGACLRSAVAAGVAAVLIPKNRAAEITPTVRKVACGATEILPIFTVTNLRREMAQMQQQGITLIGAAGEAETSIYDLDLRGPLALVLGNEGEGLRHGVREACDRLGRIPLNPAMESLNVSVACGVLLFEAVRQRGG